MPWKRESDVQERVTCVKKREQHNGNMRVMCQAKQIAKKLNF